MVQRLRRAYRQCEPTVPTELAYHIAEQLDARIAELRAERDAAVARADTLETDGHRVFADLCRMQAGMAEIRDQFERLTAGVTREQPVGGQR